MTFPALDVTKLSTSFVYTSPNSGLSADLAPVVAELEPIIAEMIARGVINGNDSHSFGFAMAHPDHPWQAVWNDPYQLVALAFGWGPFANRYIANAARKLRPRARAGVDTQVQRLLRPNGFQLVVPSEHVTDEKQDGGQTEFYWGDFPFDGAVGVDGYHHLLGAVSAHPKQQDPTVARLILGHVDQAMYDLDFPEECVQFPDWCTTHAAERSKGEKICAIARAGGHCNFEVRNAS